MRTLKPASRRWSRSEIDVALIKTKFTDGDTDVTKSLQAWLRMDYSSQLVAGSTISSFRSAENVGSHLG
jgi:hypothetical protein